MVLRDDLITRRDNIGTELAEVKNTDRHWQSYKAGLYDELKEINALLETATIDQTANTGSIVPFEEESRGVT